MEWKNKAETKRRIFIPKKTAVIIFFALALSALFLPEARLRAEPGKGAPGQWLSDEMQRPDSPKRLEMRWKKKTFRVPAPAKRSKIAQGLEKIIDIMEAPSKGALRSVEKSLAGSGYQLAEYSGPKGHWLILEARENSAGAGYFIIRTGKLKKELLLQAPHAVFDMHTDVIAKSLFNEFPVRAVFFGDWHRYGGEGVKAFKNSKWDVAHNPDSLYQDLSKVWVKKRPKTTFVQLHGFQRKGPGDKSADFVISNGCKHCKAAYFDFFTDAFSKAYSPDKVKIYPRSSKILGGTTNVQGKAIRKSGGKFIHIEMSKEFRDSVKNNKSKLEKLGRTIFDAIE